MIKDIANLDLDEEDINSKKRPQSQMTLEMRNSLQYLFVLEEMSLDKETPYKL